MGIDGSTRRLVVIGRNSALWSRIADRVIAVRPDILAIGHADLADTSLRADDCVWILSYAKTPEANRALFAKIAGRGAGEHVYLSSATANIGEHHRCYRYPAVKRQAEIDAAQILDASVVRIGLIHDDPAELPSGISAATRLDDLVAAMTAPEQPNASPANLFKVAERPFANGVEHAASAIYGGLTRLFSFWPCLLRPLDLLLRAIGWRWYGYFRISNDLWRTTIS